MKSLFFRRLANFGNVSPFLVGATNIFSELIHPLLKLNCVLKQHGRHILQLSEALSSFNFLPLQGAGQALSAYCHFHSFLIFHKHHIAQENKAKECIGITEYSIYHKIWSQVQTITRTILLQNQSPSVSNSQRGWSCEQIFDSSTTFLNPLVRMYSLYGKQIVSFFLSPHMALRAC